MNKNDDCNLCELRQNCNKPINQMNVINEPDLLVCLDRPSYEEDFVNLPLYDRQCVYLKKLLDDHLPTKKILIQYTVRCWNDLSIAKLKKASKICVDNYLSKELNYLKPKIVLAMGEVSHFNLVKPFSQKKYKEDIGLLHYNTDNPEKKQLLTTWYSHYHIYNRGASEANKFIEFLKIIETK